MNPSRLASARGVQHSTRDCRSVTRNHDVLALAAALATRALALATRAPALASVAIRQAWERLLPRRRGKEPLEQVVQLLRGLAGRVSILVHGSRDARRTMARQLAVRMRLLH